MVFIYARGHLSEVAKLALKKTKKKEVKKVKKQKTKATPKKKAAPKPKKTVKQSSKPKHKKITKVTKVSKPAPKAIAKKALKLKQKPAPKVAQKIQKVQKVQAKTVQKNVAKASPKAVAPKKAQQPIVQKVKKCKKSLCKEPAMLNGYCRYHYVAGWRTENIDKKVKKINHLEKTINEIKKRFTPEYLELIKADLASDDNFKKVIKDMDLEEDINDFEISDDTQKIIESYSSLVDLERDE